MSDTRIRRRAVLTVILSVLVTSGVLAAAAETLSSERRAITRQVEQQESNITLAVQSGIAQAIHAVDLSLQAAARAMATPGLASLDPALRQAILFNSAPSQDGEGTIIADTTGRAVYTSPGLEHVLANVFDRPQFQAHLLRADQGLFISPPMRSLTDGRWILGLSRRISHPDGTFAGVALGRLKLSSIEQFFDRLDVGAGGVINLVSSDGRLLARRPQIERDIGLDLSGSPMFGYLRKAPAGSFETVASIDGVRRLYSYRKVDDLPFIVGVGFPASEIYDAWREKTAFIGSVLGLLSALLLSAVLALWRELLGRQRGERAARLAEQRCLESQDRLDALFKHSPEIMIVFQVTPDGRFLYEAVNPVWECLGGVPATVAIGKSPQDCLPPELSVCLLDGLQACLRDRHNVTFAFQTGSGEATQEWEETTVPVLDAEGGVARIITVGRDVTELKANRLRMLASARLSALGAMAGGIAHEVNNPLAVIHAVASDLTELAEAGEAAAEDVVQAAGRIVGYVDRIGRIVTSLRYLSRDGARDPFDDVACGDIIGRALDLAAERFRQHCVALRTTPVDPDLRLPCREVQICQVLTNLLQNGFDAAQEGRGEKWVRLDVAVKEEDFVALSVTDSGPGIPVELKQRIMEPFFTTKPVGKGTGLGLSLSKQIADEHGGSLTLGDEAGHTCFTLTLPLSRRNAAKCR